MKKKITLTKEQISEVEDYLTNKKVKYVDVRFEILDHIILDIEFLIKNKKITFKEAFEDIKIKWNKNLKSRSNWLIGYGNYGPSIFINRCLEIYKPLLYKILLSMVVFIAVLYSVNKSFNYSLFNFKKGISLTIFIGLLLYIGLVLFWYIKMKLRKVNTAYSYLYRKKIMPNLFSVLIFNPYINNSFITQENKFNVIMLTMLFLFFLTALEGRYFYKKHLELVFRYKSILN